MTENNFQIYSAAVSDRGLSEKRPQNEDSFLDMGKLGLFAVADGVGGAQAGDVASQMAVEILGEAFANLQTNGDAEDMMKIAIERANSAIHQMSSDLPQLSTMATTIVALHISGNIASIGHVGDSRLYRLDSKGNLYRETQDHSVVEEEVRAGRMTAAQAANHPSRNVISRALGAEGTVEVDMKTIMFDGNTKFLLCSDGITRHITDPEIRELLAAAAPPADICRKMKDICYSRGAEDNLTAVIVNVAAHGAGAGPQSFTAPPIVDDESTVATARIAAAHAAQPFAEKVSSSENGYDEIPTRALEMPAAAQNSPVGAAMPPTTRGFSNEDDESYLMEESVPQSTPAPPAVEIPKTMAATAAPAAPIAPSSAAHKNFDAPRDFTNIEITGKNDGGFFGKILSGLLWLGLGLILGGGGAYLWQTMSAKPPEVPALTPQTNNIPKASSDTLRFEAETNPQKIIKQYETALPKDASDFYILGRAYMNEKNYDEAKKQFILARNNLKAVTDAETRAILANDITQGLTISQNKASQLDYERERKLLTGDQPSTSANSNLNANFNANGGVNAAQ